MKKCCKCLRLPRKKISPTQGVTMGMIPILTETHSDINARILKGLEEEGIDHHAYEKHMKEKYGHTSCDSISTTISTTPYTQLWLAQNQPKCRPLQNPHRNQSAFG